VLLDMAFNLGVPRLRKFKNMWAGIQEGDYIRAGDEMMDSRWDNQVGARAVRLCKMMKEGE